MKTNLHSFPLRGLLFGVLLAAASFPAGAQTIQALGSSTGSQLPGSPTDFTFVGSSSSYSSVPNYAADTIPGTTVLTDFTIAPGADTGGIFSVASDQSGGYSTISAPAGYTGTSSAPASVQTAVVFHSGPGQDAPDLLTVTFGNSATFDYSDFNVYVLFSNVGVPAQDATIDLTLVDPSGNVSLVTPVVDDAATATTAKFAEFQITGAVAGDQLMIGANPEAGANAVIGGVSFEQVPEPSTWALLGVGAACLLGRRRKLGW